MAYYLEYYTNTKARPQDLVMTGITNSGMDIDIVGKKGERRTVHIPLDPPLESAKEARQRLVNMTWEAIEGLGLSRYQVDRYVLTLGQLVAVFGSLFMYYLFLAPRAYVPYVSLIDGIQPFYRLFCISLPPFLHTLENQLLMVPLLDKHRVHGRLRAKWIFACLMSGGPAVKSFKSLVAQEKERLDGQMKEQ